MNTGEQLQIRVGLTIQKPVDVVFNAIVNPAEMSNYFIASSTGPMEAGKTLTWQFPEFDMQFPVRIQKVEKNREVVYQWDDMDGTETTVTISLTEKKPGETFVSVEEAGKNNDADGIRWLKSNTEGWANFLACMKAWVEYGINLRKGAFDPSQMPTADPQK